MFLCTTVLVIIFLEDTRKFPEIITTTGAKFGGNGCPSVLYWSFSRFRCNAVRLRIPLSKKRLHHCNVEPGYALSGVFSTPSGSLLVRHHSNPRCFWLEVIKMGGGGRKWNIPAHFWWIWVHFQGGTWGTTFGKVMHHDLIGSDWKHPHVMSCQEQQVCNLTYHQVLESL